MTCKYVTILEYWYDLKVLCSHRKKVLCFNFFFNCRKFLYIWSLFPFNNILKYDECLVKIFYPRTYWCLFLPFFGVSFRNASSHNRYPWPWLPRLPNFDSSLVLITKCCPSFIYSSQGRNWSQSKLYIFSEGVFVV